MIVKVSLEWLFNDACAAMGISSNWSAMINAAMFGGGGAWDSSREPTCFRAIDKCRQLEKAYYSLEELDQRVLWALYGVNSVSAVAGRVFGELGPLALMIGGKGLQDSLSKVESGVTGTADKSLIAACRNKATILKMSSIGKYYQKIKEKD